MQKKRRNIHWIQSIDCTVSAKLRSDHWFDGFLWGKYGRNQNRAIQVNTTLHTQNDECIWSFSFWLHLMNIEISDLCVCTKVRTSEHMLNVSLAPKEYIFQKTEIRTAQGCYYSNGNVCHPNRYIKLTLLMDHSIGFLVNLYATNCQSVRNFGLFAAQPELLLRYGL